MRFINLKSLRNKILFTVVGLILVGCSVVLLNGYLGAKNLIGAKIEDALTSRNSEVVNYIDGKLALIKSQVSVLASTNEARTAVQSRDMSSLKQYMDKQRDSSVSYEMVLVATPDGKALNLQTPGAVDISDREYFKGAMNGNIVVSDPMVSRISGKTIYAIAGPIRDLNNNIIGVIAFTEPFSDFKSELENLKLGDGRYVSLVDKAGLVIMHPDKNVEMKMNMLKQKDSKDLSDAVSNIVSGKSGVAYYKFIGQSSIAAYAPLKEADWSVVLTGIFSKEFYSTLMFGISIAVVGSLSTGAVILLIAYLLGRMLNPIMKMAEVTKEIANGDLTISVDVKSNDELGALADNFNYMILKQREVVQKILNASETVGRTSNSINTTSGELNSTTKEQAGLIEGFALTVEQMNTGIQDTTANISKLADNIGGVNAAVNEMGNSANDNAKNVENTAAAVNRVAAAIEQMGMSMKSVAQNSKQAQEEAEKTVLKSQEGNRAVSSTIDDMDSISQSVSELSAAMKNLGASAAKIGDIVDVIDEIAEQTNLLSLNAAIEAARAGDAGKGFAVVANSIRGLAERSGEATKDIAKIIKGIQNEVNEAIVIADDSAGRAGQGVKQVKGTGMVFEEIFGAINNTSTLIQQIALLIDKQEESSSEIIKSIEDMNMIIYRLSATAEQQAAGANEIVRSVVAINDLIQQVSATTEEQAASSQEIVQLIQNINKGVTEVSTGSEEMAAAAADLTLQAQGLLKTVNSFKVK